MSVDLTVWAGVKLGAGFVLGASLVGLLVWVVIVILIAAGVSAMLR